MLDPRALRPEGKRHGIALNREQIAGVEPHEKERSAPVVVPESEDLKSRRNSKGDKIREVAARARWAIPAGRFNFSRPDRPPVRRFGNAVEGPDMPA